MYLQEYHDPGLGSLRKKLKKVAKVAAHVGAAVVTGGASLAVTAAMLNAKKQKEAQQRAAADAAAQEQALLKQINAGATQPSIAPAVVTPSAGGTMPVATAPASVPPPPVQAAYVPQQPMYAAPSPSYMTQPGESGGQPMSVETPGNKPAWPMPAALIGGGVLIAMMMSGRRQ